MIWFILILISLVGFVTLWTAGVLSVCLGVEAINGSVLWGILFDGHIFVGVVVSDGG